MLSVAGWRWWDAAAAMDLELTVMQMLESSSLCTGSCSLTLARLTWLNQEFAEISPLGIDAGPVLDPGPDHPVCPLWSRDGTRRSEMAAFA